MSKQIDKKEPKPDTNMIGQPEKGFGRNFI